MDRQEVFAALCLACLRQGQGDDDVPVPVCGPRAIRIFKNPGLLISTVIVSKVDYVPVYGMSTGTTAKQTRPRRNICTH